MKNQFAIAAAVLFASITTPALAQSSDNTETLTRVIYQGQILPGAMVRRNAGPDAYDMAVVDTLNFCDSSGTRNRANAWDNYDLDVRASARGDGFAVQFAGELLEYYGDRAADRQRAQERSRDSFCDQVQDEFRDIRSQARRDRREDARDDRRVRREQLRQERRARRG